MGGRGAGPPLPYLCTAGLRRRRDGGSRPRSGSELRADGGAKRGGRSLPSTTSNLKFRKGSEERRPSFTSTLTFCMYDSRVTGGETEAQRGEVTGTGHSDRKWQKPYWNPGFLDFREVTTSPPSLSPNLALLPFSVYSPEPPGLQGSAPDPHPLPCIHLSLGEGRGCPGSQSW